jgi:hypothetical protein
VDLGKDGYSVIQKTWETGDCQQLREFLSGIHSNTTIDLVGAYLIGNLPMAYFYVYYPATETSPYEIGPDTFINLNYYQDLDGEWNRIHPEKLSTTNTFDSHIGKIDNEIWIGVLPFWVNISTTISKINAYFAKNHEYRVGINRPEKGYLEPLPGSWGVTSPELYRYQVDQVTNTQWAWDPITKRGNVGVFPDNTMNDVSRYPDSKYAWDTQVSSNKYDFMVVNFHGTLLPPNWKNPNWLVNFVIDGTCSLADISKEPYSQSTFDIGLLYGDNKVILVFGATYLQAGLAANVNGDHRWLMAHDLVNGMCFGETFLKFTNTEYVGLAKEQREYFGGQNIFLGDPTLKLQEHMPSP